MATSRLIKAWSIYLGLMKGFTLVEKNVNGKRGICPARSKDFKKSPNGIMKRFNSRYYSNFNHTDLGGGNELLGNIFFFVLVSVFEISGMFLPKTTVN